MVDGPYTAYESRLLPASVAVALLVPSVILMALNPRFAVFIGAACGFLLSLGFCLRAIYPRWVLRVDDAKLILNDIPAGKIIELDLPHITEVCLVEDSILGSDPDGGVGLRKRLILKTPNGVQNFELPFLSVPPATVVEAIKKRLYVG
jgi:hypothetical protein